MQTRLPRLVLALSVAVLSAGCQSLPWQDIEQEFVPPKVTVDGQEPTRELLEKVTARGTGAMLTDGDVRESTPPPIYVPQLSTRSKMSVSDDPPTRGRDIAPSSQVMAASFTEPATKASAWSEAATKRVRSNTEPAPTPTAFSPVTPVSIQTERDPEPELSEGSTPARQTKRIRVKGLSKDAAGAAAAVLQIDQGEVVIATVGTTITLDDDDGERNLVVSRVTSQFVEFRDEATNEVIRAR